MTDDTSRDDLSLLPEDLPDDVLVSYKPRTVVSPRVQNAADSTQAMLDSQQLSVWRVVYGDNHQTTPISSGPASATTPKDYRPALVLNQIIGKGGFGEVWEATQTSLGRIVAVKRMREDLIDKTVLAESTGTQIELSFRQEALTAANLDHPNIVPLHDLGRDEKGRSLLSMKRVRGRSWEAIIEEDRHKLSRADFLSKHLPILIDVAQAAAFAHSRGIIHRDLKPGQVMVGEFGEVYLMDWGLAVVYDREKATMDGATYLESGIAPTLAIATNPAGTLAYMAPEQTDKNAERIGPWTDVFLLGGTLYTLLTGTLPYAGSGNVAVFFKAMRGEIVPPSTRVPGLQIPEELEALCLDAMRADPGQRLRSASTFVERLQNYLSGASRRTESQLLMDEAEELYATATTYEGFGRAMTTVERASALWPGNPGVQVLSQRIMRSFAEIALQRRDLSLARIQAQRLEDEHTRAAILCRVDELETLQRETERQRKFYGRVVLLSLLIMFATAGIYLYGKFESQQQLEATLREVRAAQLEEQKRSAELRKTESELRKSKEKAEELMTSVVRDLGDELEKMGRTSLLEKVARPISEYYRNEGEPELRGLHLREGRSVRNFVYALMLEAQVARKKGSEDHAIALHSQGEEILAALHDELTTQLKAAEAEAAAPGISADAAAEAGERSKKLTADITAVDEQRFAVKLVLAELYLETGQSKAALDEVHTAKEIVGRLLANSGADQQHRLLLGRANFLGSLILYTQGSFDAALAEFRIAEGIFQSLEQLSLQDSDLRANLAEIYVAQGMILFEQGKGAEALARVRSALEMRLALIAEEPWNMTARGTLVEHYLILSLLNYDQRDLVQTQASLKQAIEVANDLLRLDGETPSRRMELSGAHALAAVMLKQSHLDSEARRNGEMAVESLPKRSPGGDAGLARDIAEATALTARAITAETPLEAAPSRELANELFLRHVAPLDKAPSVALQWYALHLLYGEDPKAARPVIAELIRRRFHRRTVYEAALAKSIVQQNDGHELLLKE